MNHNNSNPSNENNSNEVGLSPDDARLLDALAASGFDARAVKVESGAEAQRLKAMSSLLGLMKDYPVEDAEEALQHVTLARIDRHEQDVAARMNFDNRQDAVAAERRLRIRVPDFITVAAVLLIAFSVFWPVLTSMRNKSIDLACANNLRYMGMAFGSYAADYNGELPTATAGPMGTWDTVKNVLNLQPLVEGGYCEAGHLNCAGHANHVATGPSYSYRWVLAGAPVKWGNAPRVSVILGDLNPIIDAARSGQILPPLSMSINHAGRGQNVLADDGATLWLQQPVVAGGDNIWLPNGAVQLRSGEQPSDPMDVFLAH
jgi:hypothetical protein